MRVELLYFDGCPTYRTAEKTLRAVFAQEDAEAVVELVVVNTDEEAQRLRFPGSPTDQGGRRGPVPRARAGGVRAQLQDVRYPGGAEGFAHGGDGAGVVGRAQPCTAGVVISRKIEGTGKADQHDGPELPRTPSTRSSVEPRSYAPGSVTTAGRAESESRGGQRAGVRAVAISRNLAPVGGHTSVCAHSEGAHVYLCTLSGPVV